MFGPPPPPPPCSPEEKCLIQVNRFHADNTTDDPAQILHFVFFFVMRLYTALSILCPEALRLHEVKKCDEYQ